MLFAIHAIDKPNSLALRQATRPAHLEHLAASGNTYASPLLDETGEMCGSIVLLEANDLASAKQIVSDDPYNKAGLFASVVIHRMKKDELPGTQAE